MSRKPKTKAARPRRRKTGRKKRSNPLVEINHQKLLLHNPIVPKYITTLETGFIGNYPLASLASGYFDLPISNMFTPYNISGSSFGGTFLGAVSITDLQPMGYGLLSQLYNSCLTLSVKHEITITPTSPADTMNIVVVPTSNVGTLAPTEVEEAMSRPYSKSKTVIPYQNKQNMISMSMKPWVILGLSKRQWEDQSALYSVLYQGGSPNEQAGTIRVLYQTYDAGVTSALTCVQVRTTYKVMFFNPDQNLGIAA